MDDGWGTDGRMGEWVDECVGGRKEGWREGVRDG